MKGSDMVKIKYIAAAVLVFILSAPGWAQQLPDEEPQRGAGDVASTELTSVSVQTLTAINAYRMIAMRFDPIFYPRNLLGQGTRTASALPNGFTSIASGEENKGISVWANMGRNKIKDEFAQTAYDGYTNSFALGGDYAVKPWAIVGISMNYADTDIDTPFNGGDSQTKGFTLLPYANFNINKWLSTDVSVGYAWNDTDVRRVFAGNTITGSQDSEGWLAVANLNAQKWFNLVFLSAKAGLLYNQDKRSTFTESDGTVNVGRTNDLVQGNLGASIGYWMEPFMPSLSVTYTYDLDREDQVLAGNGPQPANDKDGVTIGLALSYYGSGAAKGWSVSLAATTEVLREDMENKGLSLNVRYAF
ncbi:MAG: autotransporter outer membrane beta-barrel domain-containing protein [Desulfobacteraceae bacterium]|nr:MAG: autotransporter outer membrane beta-barrel domain-containing protein [Desulfobacteraceae bacterium]